MTRSEIKELALSKIDKVKCLVLQLATGTGKTSVAIACANKICDKVSTKENKDANILIVVSKVVHKQVWTDEINKWGGLHTNNIIIECYESLKKHLNNTYNIVILDEAQHLSENRQNILKYIHITNSLIVLSATLKKELCWYFKNTYNADFIKCDIKEAIEDEVLPEPTIYLIPLNLNAELCTYRFKRFNNTLITTQRGYYNNLSYMVDYYKNRFYRTRNDRFKNLWMRACTDRLKWLSEQKEAIVLSLLDKLSNHRTLTFCSSINQSERLGKYCINSKNAKSTEYLDKFNSRLINHITSCNILNESVNLVDCKIGIFCNLNASDVIVKQRNGRILRHKKPIIIVPYYIGTREEELINKITENYKKDKIITINNINNIKL